MPVHGWEDRKDWNPYSPHSNWYEPKERAAAAWFWIIRDSLQTEHNRALFESDGKRYEKQFDTILEAQLYIETMFVLNL